MILSIQDLTTLPSFLVRHWWLGWRDATDVRVPDSDEEITDMHSIMDSPMWHVYYKVNM